MYGFARIGVATPKLEVANTFYNLKEIIKICRKGAKDNVDIMVFPELSITAYTCADLFFQKTLLENVKISIKELLKATKKLDMIIAVGFPIEINSQIFNCSGIMHKGELLGIIPKTFLPNNKEFYEKRWFASSFDLNKAITSDIKTVNINNKEIPIGADLIFSNESNSLMKIGVEICEDLWAVIPPSSYLATNGATIILNLSASNELSGKREYRKSLISSQSARTYTAYAYANASMGESTTDVVYSGNSFIYENGKCLNEIKPFEVDKDYVYSDIDLELLQQERLQNTNFNANNFNNVNKCRIIKFKMKSKYNEENIEIERKIDAYPFVPQLDNDKNNRCEELFFIQVGGLGKRFEFTKVKTAVIGISGGLDSTLALLATVKTFDFLKKDRKDIIGITMPGFGTTDRTYQNAVELIKNLGITFKEISIKEACIQHFKDIGQDENTHDVTYENTQARERTQILMDIANKEAGIVIGTGDLSEIALGWSTYNGDHMSMYGVNSGIPKTLIKSMVKWVAESDLLEGNSKNVLLDIVDTPVSPELIPPDKSGKISQKTEEIVGVYAVHDFYLYYFLRYGFSPAKIFFLAEKAFDGEYSREKLLEWLKIFYRRFFTQQFKRSCMPDGVKVGSVALSPRGDFRMPSDASFEVWFKEIETL